MKTDRLTGHSLYREGAPCDENGLTIADKIGSYELRGGEGRGACSCGQVSNLLPSSYKRRLWHKEHKAEMRRLLGLAAR